MGRGAIITLLSVLEMVKLVPAGTVNMVKELSLRVDNLVIGTPMYFITTKSRSPERKRDFDMRWVSSDLGKLEFILNVAKGRYMFSKYLLFILGLIHCYRRGRSTFVHYSLYLSRCFVAQLFSTQRELMITTTSSQILSSPHLAWIFFHNIL